MQHVRQGRPREAVAARGPGMSGAGTPGAAAARAVLVIQRTDGSEELYELDTSEAVTIELEYLYDHGGQEVYRRAHHYLGTKIVIEARLLRRGVTERDAWFSAPDHAAIAPARPELPPPSSA